MGDGCASVVLDEGGGAESEAGEVGGEWNMR